MHSIFDKAKFFDVYFPKMKTRDFTFYLSKLPKYNRLINRQITLEGADVMLAKLVKFYNGISVAVYMILISIRRWIIECWGVNRNYDKRLWINFKHLLMINAEVLLTFQYSPSFIILRNPFIHPSQRNVSNYYYL